MTSPAGDPTSRQLDQLVTRYRATALLAGQRHGLSGSDLDEVLQDVRIRIWRALGTDERIAGATASYLYRTAVSAALDLIRRRRVRQADSIEGGEVVESGLAVPAASAAEAVEHRELAFAIFAELDTLAENRRQVVRMYLAGYGKDEIGTLLGWTEAKTRNLLSRGLQDLRERLTARGITPEMAR